MKSEDEEPATPERDFIESQRAARLEKLDQLRGQGTEPYPSRFDRDTTAESLHKEHETLPAGEESTETVKVAGRLILIRHHGALSFLDLRDQTGKIQLVAARESLDAEAFRQIKSLDRGDWVGVEGTLMRTRSGELSVRITQWQLLTKALRPLPDKHRGLIDVDRRLRERHLDLISNDSPRRVFAIRSSVVNTIRNELHKRDFVEVETPVLDTVAGGAAARPFITHHNALNLDMYMRISLELPLKRLVVGGMERVFELGRVFRNEGIDPTHNPEFTLIECYQAYADYRDMMELTETLVSEATLAATGSTKVEVDGVEIDFKVPWRRVAMSELITEVNGVELDPSTEITAARKICDQLKVQYETGWSSARIMAEVFEQTCEPTLIQPTLVYDFPRELSPLARAHPDNPLLAERFEAIVAGRELANAYSELNDPVEQRKRFEAQAKARVDAGEEAEPIDEEYLKALDYGLPPTGGLGIGVDRLVAMIAGTANIREAILFPTMRPQDGAPRPSLRALASIPTAATVVEASRPARDKGSSHDEKIAASRAASRAREPGAPAPANLLPLRRPTRIIAFLTILGGILSLLPLAPDLHYRFAIFNSHFFTVDERVASTIASVVIGILLIMTAPHLAHHKRRAWWVALALFTISVFVNILRGPHPIPALYAAMMVPLLVWYREAFPARSDPSSVLGVARFVPVYLGLVTLFGALTMFFQQRHIKEPLTILGIVRTIYGGMIGLQSPYTYMGKFFTNYFPAVLLALGIGFFVTLSILLFRAVALRSGPTAKERERARELVREHGWDTLAYFALRDDKSYFFSSDGNAMIAYAFASGYALVSGDPIGAPESIARVVEEFLEFCKRRAWHVAFLAVREADLPLYRKHGFGGIYFGDEAIIDLDTFSLNAKGMKPIRTAVTRVSRDHHFRLVRETDTTPKLRGELNRIRERWRGKTPERGFTMGLKGDVNGNDPNLLLAIAFDSAERPVGFLRLAPSYGVAPGYSLDLMQRDPDAPNGVTEYLIATTAQALSERGFRRMSLNFAGFGRLFLASTSSPIKNRILNFISRALNPLVQLKSLLDFNAKFQPQWVPRCVVVEEPSALPKVGFLYGSIEGVVRIPILGKHMLPKITSGTKGADKASKVPKP